MIWAMKSHESPQAFRQRVLRQQRILTRLRLAATHLADAQLERTWAIVSAHQQGLSVRQIAAATGLSAARVHQLLSSADAQQIPRWLSRLREEQGEEGAAQPEQTSQLSLTDEQSPSPQPQPQPTQIPASSQSLRPLQSSELEAELEAEVAVLRRCIGWLEQLERGEMVVVNMHLETDAETEYVRFDGERVRRILERIAADVEKLAHQGREGSTQAPTNVSALPQGEQTQPHAQPQRQEEDALARHRHRLAEPPPKERNLSPKEERAALRAKLGLPPK